MLLKQAVLLHQHGEELLGKAKSAKETRLALDCLKESREIIQGLQHNSLQIFLEFSACLRLQLRYVVYLEFCARNGLQMLCEQDFNDIISEYTNKVELLPQTKIGR